MLTPPDLCRGPAIRKRAPDIRDGAWATPLPGPQECSVDGELKRRRTSINTPPPSASPPVSSKPNTSAVPQKPVPELPTTPLLYHLAASAHHASHRHLQQAFVPSNISCHGNAEYPIVTIPAVPSHAAPVPFTHDPAAASKAFGLLLLALDLLRIGLASNDLTYVERAAFGLEFATVGLKVLDTLRKAAEKGRGKHPELVVVDRARLVGDMQEAISSSMSIARSNPQLKRVTQQLEVLNARLALAQNMSNVAKRMTRQALKDTLRGDFAHRYTLMLLLVELAQEEPLESLGVLNELSNEATASNHTQIVQLVCIARLRLLFHHRRWDGVPSGLQQLATSIGWTGVEAIPEATAPLNQMWHASCTVHYILLQSLWEGRIGNDSKVKALLKQAYLTMDQAADVGTFDQLRADGGVVTLVLRDAAAPSCSQTLLVQATPPNITYLLTYLVTVVSRRDFMGSSKSCKNLVHARAVRELAHIARKEDMWDVGFHLVHNLAVVDSLERQVQMIRAEIMLEEILALIYRSEVAEAEEMFNKIIEHLRVNDLLVDLAPQLCLLYAQFAHLLGYDSAATRYYLACKNLIVPGSELGLIVNIGLLGALGHLANVASDHGRQTVVNDLVDRCAGGSSAGLNAVGFFLASLTDSNLTLSKKKLSTAYDICQRSNNNVLRALIFAFTTSTHLTGSEERVLKQLETGREIAMLMGGKEREDRVGQLALGLWFSIKLKRWYRMNKRDEELAQTRISADAHLRRLHELSELGARRFEKASSRLAELRQASSVA